MSLYEVISTFAALAAMKRPGGKAMSEEDFTDAIDRLRAMNLPDVVV